MTPIKSTNWDRGNFQQRSHINGQDKQTMANYVRSGLELNKSRNDLLEELEYRYGRSKRQIERYLEQIKKAQQAQTKTSPNVSSNMEPAREALPFFKKADGEADSEFVIKGVEIDPSKIEIFDNAIYNPFKDGDYSTYDKEAPFVYPFDIKIKASEIIIESIRIRSSNPNVPFRFFMTEVKTGGSALASWDKHDLLDMEAVSKAVYTSNKSFTYENIESIKILHCGIAVYFNKNDIHAPYSYVTDLISPGNNLFDLLISEAGTRDDGTLDIEKNRKWVYREFRESISFQCEMKYHTVKQK